MIVGVGAAVIGPAPAFAASTGPVAVGFGRDTDKRVLAVSGASSGTPVVAVPYIVGVSGEAVLKQRWTLEMTIYVEEEISVGYRFKNSQTGLCLTKSGSTVNNAPVTATTCSSAVAQLWDVPVAAPNGGVQLRSFVDYRCLDLAGGSTAANAAARVSTCNTGATAWYQRWKLRYGTFSCDRRSNQRILTGLCASTGAAPAYGTFGTWRNTAVTYAPEARTNPNDLDSFIEVRSLTAGNEDGQVDGVEFGLHQVLTNNVAVASPYWIEWGQGTEEYHSIGGTEGGNAADGRNHSYMLLPAAGGKQWDVLYDFTLVGTSRMQEGAQFRDAFANLAVKSPNTVSTPEPYQFRMQLIDGNGQWRRPYLGETSRTEPKTCNALLTDADPLWDEFNAPPWCMNTSLATKAGSDPLAVDYMSVAVPRAGTALTAPQTQKPATGRTATMNGIKQDQLRQCLETSPDTCLATVDGLQACVDARKTCSSPVTAARPAAKAMNVAEARRAAGQRLTASVGKARAVTATRATIAAGLRRELPAVDDDARLHVISSSESVRGLRATSDTTYTGSTMVFDAANSACCTPASGSDALPQQSEPANCADTSAPRTREAVVETHVRTNLDRTFWTQARSGRGDCRSTHGDDRRRDARASR